MPQKEHFGLGITRAAGFEQLEGIHTVEATIAGRDRCALIPKPNKVCQQLLEALDLTLPEALRATYIGADTQRKRQTRRNRK